MHVSIRCATNVLVFKLPVEKLLDIAQNHGEFCKKLSLYQHRMLKNDKKFPLDYILMLPPSCPKKAKRQKILELESIFKNVVICRLIDIRNQNLNQLRLKFILKTFNTLGSKDQDNAIEKLKQIFKGKPGYMSRMGEDIRFEKLVNQFLRVKKLVSCTT